MPSTRVVRSACPLDCPDTCSLQITTDGDEIVRVDGDRRNPVTAGFICAKVRNLARHVHSDERILRPAFRDGPRGSGSFVDVSWDEALDRIAGTLAEVRDTRGGEAILPLSYGGSNGDLSQDTTDARLFRRLGASRLARTVCAAPTTAARTGMFGSMPGVAYEDVAEARLVVLWGVNPSATGIHLVPWIREAQKRGARLVVVDPRRIPLAAGADLHLAVRPGTDLPVALSLLRWLFHNDGADRDFLARATTGADELERRAEPWTLERAAATSGVPASDLETLARWWRDTAPALVRCGWGQERNRNGGSSSAAILALPVVAGKMGVRGGGWSASNSGAWKHGPLSLGHPSIEAEPEPQTRVVNMNRVGRALLDAEPPIAALFVYNCNPMMTLPDQERVRRGLARDDLFTVAFDAVWTDTARMADVVLPATTFVEHREIRRGYGAFVLQDAAPVIPPVGEARSNVDVFADLVRRLGLEVPGEATTADALADELLGTPQTRRLAEELTEDPFIAVPDCGTRSVQMVDVRPGTPDGRIHLVPAHLDAEAPGGLFAYREDPGTAGAPLALVSPADRHLVTSTFGQLRTAPGAVDVHPDDARARGIENGDRVRLHNELGEVVCRARVTDAVRPGVLCLIKGLWARHTENGATSNALVPDTLTDLAGGACFNDARVEIERLD